MDCTKNKCPYLTTILLLIFPVFITAQVDFSSSNIPIIIIETNGQIILDDPKIVADMKTIDNATGRNFLTDSINGYNGKIGIEIRGASSQAFNKKQYAFETKNEDGSNRNVSLLDLPVENDWILSAPYSDKSLMRNVLAYDLSRALGHYAPRTRFCELVLNGEYLGVYVLTEKIKRDNNRVAISNLNQEETTGDNLTGGYIIKIDKPNGGFCTGWKTPYGDIYVQYEYPDCSLMAIEQKAYIQDYIGGYEEALFSSYFNDSTNGYKKWLNVDVAIDYLLVNEISKNIDAYYLSTFINKDKESKGGKLNFGPVWDFNIAFGNEKDNDGYITDGLLAENHIWWSRMLEDSMFCNQIKERWKYLREHELRDQNVLNKIDSLTGIVQEAQVRNFKKWDVIGSYIWPNYFIGISFEDEIRFLKSWLINRINWLDNNLPGKVQEYSPFMDYNTSLFPNPFDYFFTFTFSLNETGLTSLSLIDANGKKVANIIDKHHFEKGKHKITWNSFIRKNRLPNGVYFLILEFNGRILSKELIIKKY